MPGTATTLLLVRHGQTDWNLQGRYQGRSDVPLNPKGRQQAEEAADALATMPLDAVYSSPLVRAVDTARAIAGRHGLDPRLDDRLTEIDQGEWEGLLYADIAASYPELLRKWEQDPRSVRLPGGETIDEVADRVIAAIEEISARHPGRTVAVVTHKTAIVVVRCHYLGPDLREEMRRMPQNGGWEVVER